MRRWSIPAIALAILLVAGIAGGDAFARLALRLGFPGVAVELAGDNALRGVALAGAGNHRQAAAAFDEAGASQTYNRATALALDGEYAEALLAYDGLLVRNPKHADARANFTLLVSVYGGTELQLEFMDLLIEKKENGPTAEAPEARGGARAIGDGAEADGNATDIFAPKVETGEGIRRGSKIFDDMFIAANEDWLKTLHDQPGEFLAARLRAEQKQRKAAGIGVPEEEGAW